MCHINAELKIRRQTLFCFIFFPLFYFISLGFLSGGFSDGQTNNLVNTQTDTDRRPALQPPPHYITVFANGEQGVSQSGV